VITLFSIPILSGGEGIVTAPDGNLWFLDTGNNIVKAVLSQITDTSPPTTTPSLSGPMGNNGWYTGPVTVILSATDPDGPADVAATYYILDGGPQQTYTDPFPVSGDGVHTLVFWSVDFAGNIETPPPTRMISIDTTAPAVTASANPSVLWPPDGKMVPVTVSGTIIDVLSGIDPASAGFSVVDDYGLIQPSGPVTVNADGTYSFTVLLEARRRGDDRAGRHYAITVQANDLAGNVGSATVVVTVPHDRR
jgi:hypothetical protein